MPQLLSPDVNIIERDLSAFVASVATSIAVYVGRATRGPVWEKTQIANERQFAELFGDPTSTNYEDFFTAAGFLQYGNTLYYTRVVDTATAKNSQLNVSTGAAPSAGDGDYVADWEEYTPSFGSEKLQVYAKYPGLYGDTDFKVAMISNTDWDTIGTSPTLSGYEAVIDQGPESTDEFLVIVSVLQSDGEYEILETYLVSDTEGTKDFEGNNMYVDEVINKGSSYILIFNNTGVTAELQSFAEIAPANGADGDISEADIVLGYDLYDNPEEIEINFVLGGSHTTVATANSILALCSTRADCFAILDVPKSDVVGIASISTAVSNVTDYRKTELNANTSYGALYANWLYVYDKYNDTNRWVPSSGHVAGIYAHTANVEDTWFAPAGLNRGILRNVIKLAINPGKSYRDTLYKNQINPLVSFPGQGISVWGQKTLQTKPSAFDRVNVRLLFLYMEKAIGRTAKYVVFEQNDQLTRSIFKNQIEPFLDDIKGRRGVYDFLVLVDESVNTPERVDRNEFWCEIYVKPVKAAEYIVLRFTATKTGVDFSELT